jgi:hypothetical protein
VKQELEGAPETVLAKPMGGILTPHDIKVETDWSTTVSTPTTKKKYVEVSAFKFVLGWIILMFMGSIGFLLYKVLDDPSARPSDKNVGLNIEGPVSVAAGEPVEFTVSVANKNKVSLAYATLVITYPEGARSPADITKPLREEKKILGEIKAGADGIYRTKAIFLGEEKTDKNVLISLEYRLDGVNSSLEKRTEYIVNISASPINVTVETLREVNNGGDLELKINLVANTRESLNDVLFKIDYPFGFVFKEASQKPSFQNNVWKLGKVDQGSKQTIVVRGTLSGEDGQEKVFRTYTGTQGRQEYEIETVYGSLLSGVVIKKPFLAINLDVNGKEIEPYVANFGEALSASIIWKNNLATRVTDAEVEVTLRGTPLDRRSIEPGFGGFYRSSDDTIVWNERETPALAQIDAGKTGEVSFLFRALPAQTKERLLRNPEITLDVTIRGKRTSESGVPEEIRTVVTRTIHFTTDVKFASRLVYFDGPIKNAGPIPPRVGQQTTYTVIWSVMNTSNNVDDAVVSSRLPSYVTWENAIDPQAEDIIYDENRGTITWNVGQVTAGTGIISPIKQVAFQISVTPSLGQLGKSPDVLFESLFTGEDNFTNAPIERSASKLNTSAPTDPAVPRGGGVVIE